MSRLLKFLPVLFLVQPLFSLAQPAPTPAAERLKTMEQRKNLKERSVLNSISFRNIGPVTMSGRVVDIEANPEDPTEFYVAYASGGLWHTTNNGLSFVPIFDSADVITIGDIAVNWEKGILWIGTGEVNSSRSSYAGIGIYKSADKGKTWQYKGLPESHHIGKILLHPSDPQKIWVGVLGHLYSPNAERGVYMSTDGGDTWKQTLFIDNNTGVVEMDINPKNPQEIYAAAWYRTRRAWNFEEAGQSSGIYKSLDGGMTWSLLTNAASGFPTGDGVGRIGLTVFPGNPDLVYAILDNQAIKPDTAAKKGTTYKLEDLKNLTVEQFAQLDEKRLDSFLRDNRMSGRYKAKQIKEDVASGKLKPTAVFDFLDVNTGFEGSPIGCEVYKSLDAGKTWKKANVKDIPIFFTYGYYFAKIYVSPNNPEKVYALGFSSMVSYDGGKNWTEMDKDNVHADHHALWINPKKDSHLINGNDGGVNITYDDGKVWFKANTPAVGQFYAITTDNAKPYNVYGGLQDNGVWSFPSQPSRNSFSNSGLGLADGTEKSLGGGDGMQVQVDLRDNATVYYGSQFGNYVRRVLGQTGRATRITPSHQLGEKPYRFNWQTPIHLSRHNNDILYFGSNHFHRSLNQGDSMKTLTADLTRGRVDGNVPYGTITTISESPLRFGLLYIGSDDGNLHRSRDGGYTWEALHSQPADPKSKKKKADTKLNTQQLWVSRVEASHAAENRVYVSLNGYRFDHFLPYLYISNDQGDSWTRIGLDLPNEPINVVREDPKNDSILYVGTDGGLYVSFDRGASFMMWDKGLPRSVPIHDIAIHERDNEIILGTHGRSVYVAKLDEVRKKMNSGK